MNWNTLGKSLNLNWKQEKLDKKVGKVWQKSRTSLREKMAAKCVKNGDVWGWGWSRPTCENSWVKLRAGEGGGGGLCPQCFEWVVGHCPNTILELQLLQRKKKEVKEEQRGNIRSNYGWSLTDQKADVKEAGLQLRLICLWQQIFPPSFSPPTAAPPPPTATAAAYIPTNFQSTNDGCSFHSYISQIENCRCSCISEIGNMKWQEVWGLCRPRLPAAGRPVEPPRITFLKLKFSLMATHLTKIEMCSMVLLSYLQYTPFACPQLKLLHFSK